MKRFTTFVCLALTLAFAMNALAGDLPQRALGHDSVHHGGNADFAKSGRDTIFLIGPWGSGAQVNGQFEDQNGNPDWNDWIHYDITEPSSTQWQISDYHADVLPGGADNLAAYCGDETLPACSETDVIGGYGNSWNEILRFNYTVPDPGANCTVVIAGVISHNTEPGFDFTHFQFITADGPQIVGSLDDIGVAVPFSYTLAYGSADYVGDDSDMVTFEINVKSDGAWSDADCLYSGNGACQVDDLVVTCSNGDYSSTTDFQDNTYGDWEIGYPVGTGDFADLWNALEDIDPCFTNYSVQVAFINDGNQVPGVVGSPCVDWCYGPGGYIVNTTGGASEDPAAYLYNAIESPVVTWPGEGYLGAQLTFGIYRHEELASDSPGMFYTWSVRSAVDPADIEAAAWADRNFVYYGGPDYVRAGDHVGDLLEPGTTAVQVQLTCYELGWQWGFIGDNGYPAPYLDNVRLTAYPTTGPGLSTREIDIANDNWPEIGLVDMNNLAANNVRFDRAQNKAADGEEHNIAGDSIICNVASVRFGGQLIENRLYYTMDRNPVFDSVRDPAWGVDGYVDAQPAVANNIVQPGVFAYDLPDSGFLFPGDVLHYYFSATDEVAHANPESATLPANLDGFGNFDDYLAWDRNFAVRALPSINADGDQPTILFWNDFADRGGEGEWIGALNNLGLGLGVDYDVYFTSGPSSGVGNGLGGRATDDLMDGYTDLLYTAGDLAAYTLSNGDIENDAGNDIQLLSNYVAQNSVNMFLCGDALASDLRQSGTLTSTFLNNTMNVVWDRKDVRPMINNQTTPLVLPVTGNSVFFNTPSWIAYGGCNGINTFDGLLAGDGAERLARFANPSGAADYTFSAATLNVTNDDKIITMPYDFMYIYTNPSDPVGDGMATRVMVLREILAYFGYDGVDWNPTSTPNAEKFFATNYPNPFNPTTKIEFNMPKAGHLTLKIYNVRGELVKTLIDEARAAGSDHIMWDGTNDQGSNVSSGVYFYEARTAGEVQVNKMALVK